MLLNKLWSNPVLKRNGSLISNKERTSVPFAWDINAVNKGSQANINSEDYRDVESKCEIKQIFELGKFISTAGKRMMNLVKL
jgi:hypothetical protein